MCGTLSTELGAGSSHTNLLHDLTGGVEKLAGLTVVDWLGAVRDPQTGGVRATQLPAHQVPAHSAPAEVNLPAGLPQEVLVPVFSTLIGPDPTRLGSHWSRASEFMP